MRRQWLRATAIIAGRTAEIFSFSKNSWFLGLPSGVYFNKFKNFKISKSRFDFGYSMLLRASLTAYTKTGNASACAPSSFVFSLAQKAQLYFEIRKLLIKKNRFEFWLQYDAMQGNRRLQLVQKSKRHLTIFQKTQKHHALSSCRQSNWFVLQNICNFLTAYTKKADVVCMRTFLLFVLSHSKLLNFKNNQYLRH